MKSLFPMAVAELGPLVFSNTLVASFVLALLTAIVLGVAVRVSRWRAILETVYEALEENVDAMVSVDASALTPLVLTQWIFIGIMNCVGLLPGLQSPTRDLSLAAGLTVISFVAGHLVAWRLGGSAYLRQYIEPNPLFLPFNLIAEISRSVSMAMRLFGNMLSGALVLAVTLTLAGFLLRIPLMLLGFLTAVVQAYIFGVLTLVFAAGSMEAALRHGASSASRETPTRSERRPPSTSSGPRSSPSSGERP